MDASVAGRTCVAHQEQQARVSDLGYLGVGKLQQVQRCSKAQPLPGLGSGLEP